MEELPEILPEQPEISGSTEPVPDHITETLPPQPETSVNAALPRQVLAYELDISPNSTAKIEIEDMAEADFDRHEVLSEPVTSVAKEPIRSGMIPLSEVLQQHPAILSQPQSSFRNSTRKGTLKNILAQPLYRKALARGVGFGLAVSVVAGIVFFFINR